MGCKYHSHVPLTVLLWQMSKFGLFLSLWWTWFPRGKQLFKGLSFPAVFPTVGTGSQSPWHSCAFHLNKNILHLLVYCFFNCSQLFSFFLFFPFLNCKDFEDSDGFCLFLPLLPLSHASLHGCVLKPTLYRGGLILSFPEWYFSTRVEENHFFLQFFFNVLEVRNGGKQEKSLLFYCELGASKKYLCTALSPFFSNISWRNLAQSQCLNVCFQIVSIRWRSNIFKSSW